MPFDPQQFAAEASLGIISTEELPSAAQDAFVAGFDGQWIRRMAILENPSGWEVDQVLPKMLADLDMQLPVPRAAATFLAKARVERIRISGEDPLRSIDYFYQLWSRADYSEELSVLANLDDNYSWTDEAGVRAEAAEAMENLLDPELAARRRAARTAAWEEQRRMAQQEWPFVLNSPQRTRPISPEVEGTAAGNASDYLDHARRLGPTCMESRLLEDTCLSSTRNDSLDIGRICFRRVSTDEAGVPRLTMALRPRQVGM